jgi:hypothetical protein
MAVAVCLAVAAAVIRVVWGRRIGVTAEAALLFGLYGLWQFAGSFTVLSQAGAVSRGRWLWHLERIGHLPSETSVQRLFLPHPVLVQACTSRSSAPASSGFTCGTGSPTRPSGTPWPCSPGPACSSS